MRESAGVRAQSSAGSAQAPHAAPCHSRRSFFVRYIAASALASTVSALSWRSATAMPMLTPMLTSLPKRSKGRSSESLSRSATQPASLTAAEVLAEDCELVAAEARDRVRRAHGAAHALGGLAQQLVPGGVAETVVHALEAVEVDEQHGHALLRAARALDGVGEPVAEQHPVREPVRASCSVRSVSRSAVSFCSLMSWICETK